MKTITIANLIQRHHQNKIKYIFVIESLKIITNESRKIYIDGLIDNYPPGIFVVEFEYIDEIEYMNVFYGGNRIKSIIQFVQSSQFLDLSSEQKRLFWKIELPLHEIDSYDRDISNMWNHIKLLNKGI